MKNNLKFLMSPVSAISSILSILSVISIISHLNEIALSNASLYIIDGYQYVINKFFRVTIENIWNFNLSQTVKDTAALWVFLSGTLWKKYNYEGERGKTAEIILAPIILFSLYAFLPMFLLYSIFGLTDKAMYLKWWSYFQLICVYGLVVLVFFGWNGLLIHFDI